MKGSYSEDVHRLDFLEDFAETVAYYKVNDYSCKTEICESKVKYVENVVNNYK